MKKRYLLLFTALSGLFGQVQASQAQPPAPNSFSELDQNGDGVLSKDEVKDDRFLSAKFDELDKDGSGTLSEDELPQHGHCHGGGHGGPGGMQPPSFSQLDSNGDGVISKDEATNDKFLSEMFDKLDKDGSGTLAEDEFKAPPQH